MAGFGRQKVDSGKGPWNLGKDLAVRTRSKNAKEQSDLGVSLGLAKCGGNVRDFFCAYEIFIV